MEQEEPELGHEYFYPRPPRGGRRNPLLEPGMWRGISIHALRGEGDPLVAKCDGDQWHFYPRPPRGGRLIGRMENFQKYRISIHALRGEGDVAQKLTERMEKEFLSTPSAGRATRLKATKGATTKYFYPRPPRGGRLKGYLDKLNAEGISIHALRGEGDPYDVWLAAYRSKFLSTPSAGRATRYPYGWEKVSKDFYPRPPQGGRRRPWRESAQDADFYPRPPQGGRRACFLPLPQTTRISIHALRKEGDPAVTLRTLPA